MSMQTAVKPAQKKALHPTRNDLPESIRQQSIESLNKMLAAALDLKTHTKHAHWNVKGKDFFQLHELFDQLASELEEYVDQLAERATALGGTALGTLRSAASASPLPEYPLDIFQGRDHLCALAERYAILGKEVRQAIDATAEAGDAGTSDLYTGISRGLDQRLWFIEAHLE